MKSDRTKAALLLCAVLSGAPLTAVHTVARDRRQVSTSALLHGAFFIVYQLIGFWFLAPAIVSPLQKKKHSAATKRPTANLEATVTRYSLDWKRLGSGKAGGLPNYTIL